MSMSSSSTRSLVESSFVFVEALNVGSILPNRGGSPLRSCSIRSAETGHLSFSASYIWQACI